MIMMNLTFHKLCWNNSMERVKKEEKRFENTKKGNQEGGEKLENEENLEDKK